MKYRPKQAKISFLVLACSFTLSACIDGTTTNTQSPDQSSATKSVGKKSEVAAPEVFSANDRAVWDGRPTLGGLWVAHPKADTPSRATITNIASGKTITGALWSKTPGIPGPPFTVSSDLAAALGMQAGTPVELRVVALKDVVKAAPEPAEVEIVEEQKATSTPSESDDAEQEDAAVAAASAEAVIEDEKPKRKPFRLFGRRADKAEKEEEAAAEPTEPDVTPQPETTSGTGRAVQVGLFSDKANADAVAAQLNKAGFGSKLVSGKSSSGAAFWRVLTGPATDKAAETKLLSDVKALGFKDAYLVKG